MSIVLNIGLQVGSIVPHDQLANSISKLAKFLKPTAIRTGLAQSNSEPTLVVELTTEVNDVAERIYELAVVLSQDAIAYTHDGVGQLVGPRSADWGDEFNRELFINPSWSK